MLIEARVERALMDGSCMLGVGVGPYWVRFYRRRSAAWPYWDTDAICVLACGVAWLGVNVLRRHFSRPDKKQDPGAE